MSEMVSDEMLARYAREDVVPAITYADLHSMATELIARRAAESDAAPVYHMAEYGAGNEDPCTHAYWLESDDRTKEWFNIPLYALPAAPEK